MFTISQLYERQTIRIGQWQHEFWLIFDLEGHFFAHSEIRKVINITEAPLVSARACIFQCISRINATLATNVSQNSLSAVLSAPLLRIKLRIKLKMQVTFSTLTSAHTAVVNWRSHFLLSRGLNGKDSSARGLTNSKMRA